MTTFSSLLFAVTTVLVVLLPMTAEHVLVSAMDVGLGAGTNESEACAVPLFVLDNVVPLCSIPFDASSTNQSACSVCSSYRIDVGAVPGSPFLPLVVVTGTFSEHLEEGQHKWSAAARSVLFASMWVIEAGGCALDVVVADSGPAFLSFAVVVNAPASLRASNTTNLSDLVTIMSMLPSNASTPSTVVSAITRGSYYESTECVVRFAADEEALVVAAFGVPMENASTSARQRLNVSWASAPFRLSIVMGPSNRRMALFAAVPELPPAAVSVVVGLTAVSLSAPMALLAPSIVTLSASGSCTASSSRLGGSVDVLRLWPMPTAVQGGGVVDTALEAALGYLILCGAGVVLSLAFDELVWRCASVHLVAPKHESRCARYSGGSSPLLVAIALLPLMLFLMVTVLTSTATASAQLEPEGANGILLGLSAGGQTWILVLFAISALGCVALLLVVGVALPYTFRCAFEVLPRVHLALTSGANVVAPNHEVPLDTVAFAAATLMSEDLDGHLVERIPRWVDCIVPFQRRYAAFALGGASLVHCVVSAFPGADTVSCMVQHAILSGLWGAVAVLTIGLRLHVAVGNNMLVATLTTLMSAAFATLAVFESTDRIDEVWLTVHESLLFALWVLTALYSLVLCVDRLLTSMRRMNAVRNVWDSSEALWWKQTVRSRAAALCAFVSDTGDGSEGVVADAPTAADPVVVGHKDTCSIPATPPVAMSLPRCAPMLPPIRPLTFRSIVDILDDGDSSTQSDDALTWERRPPLVEIDGSDATQGWAQMRHVSANAVDMLLIHQDQASGAWSDSDEGSTGRVTRRAEGRHAAELDDVVIDSADVELLGGRMHNALLELDDDLL